MTEHKITSSSKLVPKVQRQLRKGIGETRIFRAKAN